VTVPGQLSVAGFDNITYAAFTNPSLTTFDQPKREIGREAARLLLELLSANQVVLPENQQVKVLQGTLLVRESTGIAFRNKE